jgi:glyoxylase-like metal-dependent hydrolase (beta-lactamase superfamily II)
MELAATVVATCLLPLLPLLTTSSEAQQQDWADVEITTVTVGEGVYMLMGRGGNIGLSAGEDGTFLVDDQFAPLTEKIEAAVAKVTDRKVQFLVNTHWHGDHTGGNENFGKRGTIIVAHDNVRQRMSVEQFRKIIDRRTPASPPGALPRITFTEAVTFHWNGDEVRIFHAPHAHTDGDSIIRFTNANVIHMGDTFFNGRYPFIDVDSGGNVNGVIATANRVLAVANSSTKIIPGHGELASPEDLRAYRDMLTRVRDRVQTMVNDGKSIEEVVAAKPTAEFDASWEREPERFVRSVYHSLKP